MSHDNIDKILSYKKKGQRARVDGEGVATTSDQCYINEIPIELFTHIVSLLAPKELSKAAQVCKHWRWIITDDSCWKSAFIQFFGCLPFRRLASDSWKNEYIIRTKLLRKWEKGRGLALSFDPRVGVIHNLYVESVNSWMLAGSLEKGMVSRSDPKTGKISKDIIFSTQERVSHSISAMLIDRHRILWGYRSGAVGLTTLNKHGLNRFFKQFLDFHAGPVSSLAWSNQLTNIVASGGEDGLVNLWDVNSGRCIESLHTTGTANGAVHIWSMDSTTISSSENSPRDKNIPHDKIVGTNKVISLHYIESSNALIVAYEGSSEIKQFDLKTLKCICVFKDGHLGNVTCTVIDIQENKSNSNEGGIKSLNILASGDTMGIVCLWKIDGDNDGIQKPCSLDGSVIAFNPLTSNEICTLYQRPRRMNRNQPRVAVTCIYSKEYRTVVTIGGQIKTWDFEPDIVKGNKAKTSRKKNTSVSTPKYMKLQNDVRESTQIFELEKQEREEHLAKMLEYAPIPGLTNEEMLAYALMISNEEHQTEDDLIAEALRRSLEIQEHEMIP
ncbi:10788_t:CDS:10 [Funneliformis caledonium]|uniref:10788_t:CDS:1 n=1 Tax=Funneliformis caledonium TaxID=1117310 RepID=A0A9N9BM43_9GLOM|nr:10788_t:CDS:10 [Funneliformis caledonium]